MKKLFFLLVFLFGAANLLEAVRGHRACMEQREQYGHMMLDHESVASDAIPAIIYRGYNNNYSGYWKKPWICCFADEFRYIRKNPEHGAPKVRVGDINQYRKIGPAHVCSPEEDDYAIGKYGELYKISEFVYCKVVTIHNDGTFEEEFLHSEHIRIINKKKISEDYQITMG